MPVASDKLNIYVSDGAIMSDANFRILAGILSSPVDLLACRLRSVMDTFSILISRKENDEFVIEKERLAIVWKASLLKFSASFRCQFRADIDEIVIKRFNNCCWIRNSRGVGSGGGGRGGRGPPNIISGGAGIPFGPPKNIYIIFCESPD